MIGQWAPVVKAFGSRDHSYSLPIQTALTPTTSHLRLSSASRGPPDTRIERPIIDLDDDDVIEEMRQAITNTTFSEAMDGMSADAQLFLGKVPWCSPGMVWSDIDHLVPFLSKVLQDEDRLLSSLKIDVFHAEQDNMVGKKGSQWFDNCWDTQTSTYHYSSETVKGADHDYLLDPALGASASWLQRVRDAVPRPASDEKSTSSTTRNAMSWRTRSFQRTIGWFKRLTGRLHRH